jgi:hypothetical protein
LLWANPRRASPRVENHDSQAGCVRSGYAHAPPSWKKSDLPDQVRHHADERQPDGKQQRRAKREHDKR